MSVAAAGNSTLALSGLASGLDWTSIINDMVTAESAPETTMEGEQTTLGTKKTAYQTIKTDLTTLNGDITTLNGPDFFQTRTASTGSSFIATATAAAGTATGNYNFNISQLATQASWQGATAAVNPISSSSDVAGVNVGTAGFSTPITAGTFTVNGQTITVAANDTLQSIFDQINSATDGAVTASYNTTSDVEGSPSDQITLSSSGKIVLGSATDTSNFLQVAQLYNNGGTSITSASALGSVNLNNAVSDSNLATTVTDGGDGDGAFEINGVTINYDASTDSINTILQNIDNSAAGVTATYDLADNQFQLTNNSTGDVGISMKDVTGNFLQASGLQSGTLQSGKNLQYSVNNGSTLTSESNTIDSTSSGLTGLSVTATGEGSTTVSVQSDTTTIGNAINSFVTDYNAVQTYISSQTASTTSATGVATPGPLTGDMDAEGIASQLRQLTGASPSGLGGGVQTLNDIGITSDGQDNLLTLDSTTLASALNTNLSSVAQLFTAPTNGVATTLGSYITTATGTSGVIASQTSNFTNEISSLATSISNLQSTIQNNETNLQNQFVTMESAISTINSNKQYLTDFFAEPTAASAAPTPASSSSSSSTS